MTPLSHLASAQRPPGHVVAWRGGELLDWARFGADIAAAAAELAGCRRGALVCRDSYWFAVGLFGLLAAGATVVLPPNAQPATLAGLADQYDALVGDDAELAGLTHLLRSGAGFWRGELDASACRLDFFTSGSTGAPKRVTRSLAQLEGEVAVLEALWGRAVANAPVVATVPHQHIYGMTFKLLWPLASGRPFAAGMHDVWESLLADLPSGGVVVSSPAHLSRLGGLAPLPVAARPRLVLSAGAPLAVEAARACRDVLGVLPTEIFGSTETGAIASRSQDSDATAWVPLPGNRVDRQEDGRLRLLSPYVAPDRWVELADRGRLDPDGGFHLLGRADRVAKIEGKRIDLADVEQALRALDAVADAAVTVVDDGVAVLAAVVVLSPDGRDELARLGPFRFGRLLRRGLAASQEPAGMPRRWRYVAELPNGAMGKRSDLALAALFEPAESPRLPRVTAVRRAATTAEVDLAIDPDLIWFQGHFPDLPILAGVVQLDWALDFARRHFGFTQLAARQFQIKFKGMIFPGDALTLVLRHDAAKGRLAFEYRRGDQSCTVGSMVIS